jgi:hypothetical protein
MKQIVTFLVFSVTLFSQSVSQLGVSPDLLSGTDSLFNADPYGAGRGANVADLDGDGKKEVWITSYTKGGRVFCFEETTDGTLAFVWASPELDSTDYGSTPRDLGFGDMDGDGNHEVIFHIGRFNGTSATQDNGIYIYDNTGDNAYDNVFHANMMTALNDSLYESRVEGFTVDDLDGDGKHEILLASNGSTNPVYGTQDGSTAYSEDRYIVMGMTGSIGGALQDAALTTEFAMAPRDVDKDGNREDALGGGSPQDIIVADIDGDGLKEAHCLAWNNAAYFNFEATGADAYSIGDTNFVKLGESDDWTLGMAAADVDGDGKHEVYISGYYDSKVWVITDADGDAGTLDTTGSSLKTFAGNTEIGIMATNTVKNGVAAGSFGLAMGGAPGSDLHHWAYGTGSILDSASWTHAAFSVEDSATGFVPKIASVDWDGDTNPDFLLAYQGVSNSKAFHADSANWSRVFRIVEVDMTTATVEDLAVITPEDYKLNQNYPNPFNPTTNIEFTLPVANNISLKIFNMVGQEVISLVSQSMMDAGSHSVMWNGLDKNGVQVSSGTYIYKLEYGNMSKVRQMTFMK